MKKILLVGNNNVEKQTLLRGLTPPSNEWEVDWILGGQQALEQLSHQNYDAIICFMDLPGLSGVNLLEIVRKHYPHIVRFMISEKTTPENQFKIAGAAHQILPLEEYQSHVSILQRTFALNNLLQQPDLQRLVLKLRNLPSLPSLYMQIMSEIDSPATSLEHVGSIISQDPAMTAKILQLVNSPFFGPSHSIVNPAQAASLLGIDIIRGLVLCINVFSQFNPVTLEKLGISSLWEHSVRTGTYAKNIAKYENADKKDIDYSFIGGILHDIGKLILADNFPVQYFSALNTSIRKDIELCEAEVDVFGATHSQVGGYLLGLWGLPQPIVESVAFHHFPLNYPGKTFTPITATHAANYIDHKHHPNIWTRKASVIQYEYIERIQLTNHIENWETICKD